MTVTSDALDMLAGDPVRERKPGDFHRHPTTGAPYVIVEKDGKRRKVMYGRPSSFGSALDNPYNLLKWKERRLLCGLLLLLKLGLLEGVDPDDRDKLDALIAYAYDVAETSLAADRGTHVHLLCEWWDKDKTDHLPDLFEAGERLGIPTELQGRILEQWQAFRERLGVTALAVEQTVVNDRWRLAGTLDRLDVTSTPILTAYGILDGAFVGDIKTGGLTVGSDGQPNWWSKYPIQLAAYVDAVPYDTETDERGEW